MVKIQVCILNVLVLLHLVEGITGALVLYKTAFKKLNKVNKATDKDIKKSIAAIDQKKDLFLLSDGEINNLNAFKDDLKDVKEKINGKFQDILKLLNSLEDYTLEAKKIINEVEEEICDLVCSDDPDSKGMQFSGNQDSYILYDIPFSFFTHYRQNYTFTMEFRTTATDGIVIFSRGDLNRRQDHLGIYMKNGHIYHAINNFQVTASVSSLNQYNDGKSHRAKFVKRFGEIEMEVDDEILTDSTGTLAIGSDTDLELFFGGLRDSVVEADALTLLGVKVGFNGCLRNIRLYGQCLGEPAAKSKVQFCTE